MKQGCRDRGGRRFDLCSLQVATSLQSTLLVGRLTRLEDTETRICNDGYCLYTRGLHQNTYRVVTLQQSYQVNL